MNLFKRKNKSKEEDFNPKDYLVNGCLPSPYDERDYKINRIIDVARASRLPDLFSLQTYLPPVMNQGSVGSCVAHVIAQHSYVKEKRENNSSILFSTNYIYGLRLPNQYYGTGLKIREALGNTIQYGVLPYKYLPGNSEYDLITPTVMDNLQSYVDNAIEYRNKEYCRLNTFEEMKNAIYTLRLPILVSIPAYKELYNPSKDGKAFVTITEERKKEKPEYGNHAVLVYGWNTNGWLVRNSWSTKYGNNGNFVLDYNYKINEAWAIYDLKNLPKLKDVAVHWAKKQCNYMYNSGFMTSYNGNFCPNNNITFEHTCMIFYRMFIRKFYIDSKGTKKYDSSKLNYSFNGKTHSYWAYDGIATCIKEGIIEKKSQYNLYKPVTRIECFTMLYNLINNNFKDRLSVIKQSKLTFKDYNELTETKEHSEALQYLLNIGIINGYTDNTIKPYNQITNAEIATIMFKLIFLLTKY